MTAQLTVLGSCGAWPERGRACSGFLLEYDGFRVVLDLGYGTFSRLAELVGSDVAAGVDAIIVTHSHPDHMVDAHALMRARLYGAAPQASLPLYAPEGVVTRLASLEEDDVDAVAHVFSWVPLPNDPVSCGPFELVSIELPHFVENVGVRLSCGNLTVAYTGDTGPCADLAELGENADLFIVDATERHQKPGRPDDEGPEMLLTGVEAGKAASDASARRLLLTHFWPGNDRSLTRHAAESVFDGETLVADEGMVIELMGPGE